MANHRIEITLDVLAELREMVRGHRTSLGLSLRTVEELSGVPFNTIARFEADDGDVTLSTAVHLLRWVNGSPAAIGRQRLSAR